MKRRKALKLTSGFLGTAIIGSELFLIGCNNRDDSPKLFSDSDINLLDEIGEVILPKTELSPGAKDAKIGLFMVSIVTDCYSEKEQHIFRNGLMEMNRISRERYEGDFLKLDQKQKFELVAFLDKKTREFGGEHLLFFPMIKQLTIWGYFTSELGATKALKYVQTPGKFMGCISYKNGDKAWS